MCLISRALYGIARLANRNIYRQRGGCANRCPTPLDKLEGIQ